jgi:hypothetical protein
MAYPPFAFQIEDYSDLERRRTRREWIIRHNETRINMGIYARNPFRRLVARLLQHVLLSSQEPGLL